MWRQDMPEHEHDCDRCVFLGNWLDRPRIVKDLYFCPGSDGGTIVVRNSSEPSDYWSMSVSMLINPAYTHGRNYASTAIKRAITLGVLTKNDMWNAAKYI